MRHMWKRERGGAHRGKAALSEMIRSLYAKGLKGESCNKTQHSSQQKQNGGNRKKISKTQVKAAPHSACLPLLLLPHNLHIAICFCFLCLLFIVFSLPVTIFLPSESLKVFFSIHIANLLCSTGGWKLIPIPIRKTSFWMAIKIKPCRGDAISAESWLFTEHFGSQEECLKIETRRFPKLLILFPCEKWEEASTCDDGWGITEKESHLDKLRRHVWSDGTVTLECSWSCRTHSVEHSLGVGSGRFPVLPAHATRLNVLKPV